MNELGSLSAVYESNGDPACVSSGVNDAGGISYGTYQLASNCGSVDDKRFDYDIIACIYDVCMSTEWNNSALRDNLNERFADEKFRALEMLQNELNEV